MKRTVALAVLCIILVGAFFAFNWYDNQETRGSPNYRDITFMMSGEPVRLAGGYAETETMMGAASKTVVRYFGNEARTDLDDDGREDVVFLVTQETGGSGTFFYAVAALNTERGYVGSEAVLLGDRIAPQTTEVDAKGDIIVNFAERRPDEPMTARPSMGKSLYLRFDAEAMRFGELVQDFEGESDRPR